MNNKKKLFRLSAFLILTFLSLWCFSCLIDTGVRYSHDNGFEKVNAVLTAKIDPDIIAFGSSVGEKSFNSPVISAGTGLTAYNCCIDGTNFEQYKGLIEEFGSYSSKNKLVLFFESYFSLQKLSGISSIDRFCAYLDNPLVYRDLANIDPGITWKSRYIPLYKNTVVDYTYYKAAVNGWKERIRHRQTRDSLSGFVPYYGGWQVDQDARLNAVKPFTIFIDKDVIADYVEVIRKLRRHGKRLVIVLPPIYARLYMEKTDFGPLENTLDSIARITGSQFWDFAKGRISTDKTNFYNTNHLNYHGSLLFSRQLSDSIQKYCPAKS